MKDLKCFGRLHGGHHIDVAGQHGVAQSRCIGKISEDNCLGIASSAPILFESFKSDAAAFIPIGKHVWPRAICSAGKVGGVFFEDDTASLGEVVEQVVVAFAKCDGHNVGIGGDGRDFCKLGKLHRQDGGGFVIEKSREAPHHVVGRERLAIVKLCVTQHKCVGQPVGRDFETFCQSWLDCAIIDDANETFVHVVQQHLRNCLAGRATDVEVGGFKREPERDLGCSCCRCATRR